MHRYAHFRIANEEDTFEIFEKVSEKIKKEKHHKKEKTSLTGLLVTQSQGKKITVKVEMDVSEQERAKLKRIALATSPVRLEKSQLLEVEKYRSHYFATYGKDLVVSIEEIEDSETFIDENNPEQSYYFVEFNYSFNNFV